MDQCGEHELPLSQLTRQHVDFVAIDFETATGDPNSACAVGLAFVVGLEVVATVHRLIQPPGNRYDQGNIRVHGIYPEDTEFAPAFLPVWQELHPLLAGKALIAHNARFDMTVIKASLAAYGDPCLRQYADFKYIDSIAMVRDLVPGRKNLPACAQCLGLELDHHHNAQCDAVVCAQIAVAAIKAAGCLNLGEFCFSQPHIRIQELADLPLRPAAPKQAPRARRTAQYHAPVHPREITPQATYFDKTHPFYQKSLVFTGELTIGRREAMQRAVNVGGILRTTVSRKTDFLVVGRQFDGPDGTATVSNKERRAREILAEGKSKLRLLEEAEFFRLLQGSLPPASHSKRGQPRHAAAK